MIDLSWKLRQHATVASLLCYFILSQSEVGCLHVSLTQERR